MDFQGVGSEIQRVGSYPRELNGMCIYNKH